MRTDEWGAVATLQSKLQNKDLNMSETEISADLETLTLCNMLTQLRRSTSPLAFRAGQSVPASFAAMRWLGGR